MQLLRVHFVVGIGVNSLDGAPFQGLDHMRAVKISLINNSSILEFDNLRERGKKSDERAPMSSI